ncbi:hypothetical protein STCU_02193 [Strigomonas culicis]|uniref:Uncharacterized protein n=1 Tax=Strigomonas culicis TaxID=28005 RepID=S9UX80_9TRYP|nr:hypothetical protein STCU_02193 [Strigomonas culicis]|eukprot:EPY33488.1 hypothetical protein STCU_02193 [Strigomonas culicis]
MRRSVFYMGRAFTQRHLNATRSPLMTGFVRPTAISFTQQGLASSPLFGGSLLNLSGGASGVLALSGAEYSSLVQMVSAMVAEGTPVTFLANLICLQNMSTCVFACEKVFGGFTALKCSSTQ